MRLLADLDVLLVDCQSTGASPAFGSVLELGWGVARASRPGIEAAEARWIALPEGQIVSQRVQKITGWEPAFGGDAIPDSEAWTRLRRAVGFAPSSPTAIHYASFELAFLREWSARLEPDAPFPLDAVCVHAIARRLYPELPRRSLRALAGHLGHGVDPARRSQGHVEATAFVWRKLCEALATRGIMGWEELQSWLSERPPAQPRSKKPRYPIDAERYRVLPDEPGVYRFLRSNGDLLYVGKAASLKKRAASHFTGRPGSQKSPEMLTQVNDISFTVVPSALEAALLESETIRALRPPYNLQLTAGDPRVWYSSRDFTTAVCAPDAQHGVGPLASESTLRPLGALIALVSGAPATAELRAHAVGVSDLWPPGETVFEAGFRELAIRHPAELAATADPRGRALLLARKLLLSGVLKAAEEADDAAQKAEGWDVERVARHLERAAAQALQAYRRTRWLELIHDCDIVYREPRGPRARLLRVRDGEVVEAADATEASPGTRDWPPPRAGERAVFDRAKYDRLRILTTELKRIARDRGRVEVRVRGRRVPMKLLSGVLRLV